MLKRIVIRSYEVGLKFREGEFKGLLGTGKHWIVDPLNKNSVPLVKLEYSSIEGVAYLRESVTRLCQRLIANKYINILCCPNIAMHCDCQSTDKPVVDTGFV